MEIIVSTIQGTFIVPQTKTEELIHWLQQNAVKQGQKTVGEIKENEYSGRQLINE
jgi:hypothetical protein